MKLVVQGSEAYAYTGGKPFDPALPCVVFVHGACNDHSVWTLHARWFAHHGWSVLAVDLPSHVRSAGPLRPDVESLADWVLALLDAAGAERAAWVGHSMGSLIALEAASRAPARATHLVMVGTAYPMAVSDALLATAGEAPDRAISMVAGWSISTLASKPGYPAPGSWLYGGTLALMRRVQAASREANLFRHDFEVCNRYAGGMEAAARVACPTTMILGDADQMTPPRATHALAAALRARVVTVPAGHNQTGEAPDAVLHALRDAVAAAG